MLSLCFLYSIFFFGRVIRDTVEENPPEQRENSHLILSCFMQPDPGFETHHDSRVYFIFFQGQFSVL